MPENRAPRSSQPCAPPPPPPPPFRSSPRPIHKPARVGPRAGRWAESGERGTCGLAGSPRARLDGVRPRAPSSLPPTSHKARVTPPLTLTSCRRTTPPGRWGA